MQSLQNGACPSPTTDSVAACPYECGRGNNSTRRNVCVSIQSRTRRWAAGTLMEEAQPSITGLLTEFFHSSSSSKPVLVEFLPLSDRLKILQRMWDECYDPKLGDPAIPNDGLLITPFNITEQYPCVLITLPEPQASPEAHHIALVPGNFIITLDATESPVVELCATSMNGNEKDPSWGVFERDIKGLYVTLEKGVEEGQTFLCEWKESGAHYNYGEGSSPDKDVFIPFLIGRIFPRR